MNKDHFNNFFRTMRIRQDIWYNKVMEEKQMPWTNEDEILSNYKFTNVYRELDRASQWLINNIIKPYNGKTIEELDNLIFQIIIFRLINNERVFSDYGLTLPSMHDYNPSDMYAEFVRIRENYGNPFHTAYMSNMVFANKLLSSFEIRPKYQKDYAYSYLLFPKVIETVDLIRDLLLIDPENENLIPCVIDAIEEIPAFSHFMSHEIFIDFCYCNIFKISYFYKFNENEYTNVGPGAKQGLEHIFGEASKELIAKLRDEANVILPKLGFKFFRRGTQFQIQDEPNITLHQIEMWLCEYQKYVKMKKGFGKQRSKYVQYEEKNQLNKYYYE